MIRLAVLITLAGALHAQVPLEEAARLARSAKRLLASPKSPRAQVQAGLRLLEKAVRKPPAAPDAKALRKFRKLALRVFLTALRYRITSEADEPVRWFSARSLRHFGPDSLDDIERWLERGFLRERSLGYSHRFLEALCESILRVDPVAGYRFLLESFVQPNVDVPSTRRTHAALLAMYAAPLPKVAVRREAIKRVLAQFQQFPFHIEEDYDYVADHRNLKSIFRKKMARHAQYWAEIRPLVEQLLRRLTAHPVTGELAKDVDSGLECETLPRFKVWNGRMKSKPIAQWRLEPGAPQPRTTVRYVRPYAQGFYLRWTVPWTTYWHLDAARPARDLLTAEREKLAKKVMPRLLLAGLSDPLPEVRAMAAIGIGRLKL